LVDGRGLGVLERVMDGGTALRYEGNGLKKRIGHCWTR